MTDPFSVSFLISLTGAVTLPRQGFRVTGLRSCVGSPAYGSLVSRRPAAVSRGRPACSQGMGRIRARRPPLPRLLCPRGKSLNPHSINADIIFGY